MIACSAVLIGLSAACAGDPPASLFSVRDSAGVRITEIPTTLAEAPEKWSVPAEPTVDIGVEEGDPAYELDRVIAADLLADGSIVVANAGTSELRLFDSAGRHIRSLGHNGEGPGEFLDMTSMQVVPPDTIVVMDPELRRITALTADGKVQWITSAEGVGYAWPGDFRLPDGSFIFLAETGDVWTRIRAGQTRPGTTARNTAVLIRYQPSGTLIDTIGRFAGYEEAIIENDGRPATTYPPWGRLPRHAVAADRIFVGTQDSAEVRAFRPDGTLAEIVRWVAGNLSITDGDLDEFNEVQFQRMPNDSAARQAVIDRTSSLPLPDARPAYGQLLVGDDGLLWISDAHIAIDPPSNWTAVDPGAGSVAAIHVPDNFEVFRFGERFVLGVWTDDLGVQHVRTYPLQR